MKLLVFSDLHRDRDGAERLVELAQEAGVMLGQIHQCWGGEAGIGTTPVVNVGPDGRLLEV
jgi:Icc-related predicted phosphoesterase